MSTSPLPVVSAEPGLSQLQRLFTVFYAPSKTFADFKRSSSWWLPFLLTAVAGGILFFAITEKVTWQQVYENNQQASPEWAKRMQDQQPPEAKAQAARIGPISQEVTWALSPIFLLIINVAAAGALLFTINFGFGGKAKFGAVLGVTMYATVITWGIRLLLGALALFFGLNSEAFEINNVAGTNPGFYLSAAETPKVLLTLARFCDVLTIWGLVVTSIGVAAVAGTKRSSGYIAVFGWWFLWVLIFVGLAAI
jgi:hypothetical protein